MIVRGRDAIQSSRPRRKPGWWHWRAGRPRSWVIPTSCGRLLAAHARQHGPSTGHPSLAKLAQGTVCKILGEHEVKQHKVRYYLDQRDPEFEAKMAEILCVYRHVAMLREHGAKDQDSNAGGSLAIVSYDEKPGIQAIGTTAPDRPPLPGTSPTVMRDHEYKRHGTLTYPDGRDRSTHWPRPRPRQGTSPQPRIH